MVTFLNLITFRINLLNLTGRYQIPECHDTATLEPWLDVGAPMCDPGYVDTVDDDSHPVPLAPVGAWFGDIQVFAFAPCVGVPGHSWCGCE